MASNNCVILFDQNEHGTYFTGQIVTGRVIVTLLKPKKLRGIKLEICGYAFCQWKDKRGKQHPEHSTKKRRKNVYSGREDYIASITYLAGSEVGNNFNMEPGTYTYTFACAIPTNCPSSFEGSLGHIRYMAKVSFIRSGASNRTTNVGFTVLKMFDLNQDSRLLKAPMHNEAMENFCLLHTKAVHLRVDITQSGYVPGQFILVSANVRNESTFDCKKLLILLNLRATFTSDTPCMRTCSEKICLVKKICGPVPRHTVKDFAESIRVPATPPTCEHLSKVVRVSYEICVIAVMNHFMQNPKAFIPITIGNVPLVGSDNPVPRLDNVPTTSACAMQMAASMESLDDGSATEGDDEEEGEIELPPPTYEQAMFMTTNIADDDVNTVSEVAQFTPRYPVFNVDEMMAANAVGGPQSPPPNKPQKRPKKKRRQGATLEEEKPPRESPVEI